MILEIDSAGKMTVAKASLCPDLQPHRLEGELNERIEESMNIWRGKPIGPFPVAIYVYCL
jgi:hypothetical protein